MAVLGMTISSNFFSWSIALEIWLNQQKLSKVSKIFVLDHFHHVLSVKSLPRDLVVPQQPMH